MVLSSTSCGEERVPSVHHAGTDSQSPHCDPGSILLINLALFTPFLPTPLHTTTALTGSTISRYSTRQCAPFVLLLKVIDDNSIENLTAVVRRILCFQEPLLRLHPLLSCSWISEQRPFPLLVCKKVDHRRPVDQRFLWVFVWASHSIEHMPSHPPAGNELVVTVNSFRTTTVKNLLLSRSLLAPCPPGPPVAYTTQAQHRAHVLGREMPTTNIEQSRLNPGRDMLLWWRNSYKNNGRFKTTLFRHNHPTTTRPCRLSSNYGITNLQEIIVSIARSPGDAEGLKTKRLSCLSMKTRSVALVALCHLASFRNAAR